MKAILILLMLSLPAPLWAQGTNALYSINADTVHVNKRTGVTTYEGHAKVKILNLSIRARTISIFTDKGRLSKVEASGNPITFSQNGSAHSLSGTARKVTFEVPQLKLTLLDYRITDPEGNTMKGKKGVFLLKH